MKPAKSQEPRFTIVISDSEDEEEISVDYSPYLKSESNRQYQPSAPPRPPNPPRTFPQDSANKIASVQQGLANIRDELGLGLSSGRPVFSPIQRGFHGPNPRAQVSRSPVPVPVKQAEVIDLSIDDVEEVKTPAPPFRPQPPLRTGPDAIPKIIEDSLNEEESGPKLASEPDSAFKERSEPELELEPEPEPGQGPEPEPLLTAEGIKDLLTAFKRDMGKDHALSARVILEDSRQGHQRNSKLFPLDKSSPFACLKSIHTSKDRRKSTALGSVTVTRAKRLYAQSLIRTHIPPSGIPDVPKHKTYINVKRNVITPDEEWSKYTPTLDVDTRGDADSETCEGVQSELKKYYPDEVNLLGFEVVEYASQVRPYIDSWISRVFTALGQSHDLDAFKLWLLEDDQDKDALYMTHKHRDVLLKYYRITRSLTPEFRIVASLLENSFAEVFVHDLLGEVLFPTSRVPDMARWMEVQMKKEKPSQIRIYANYSCLICGMLGCLSHAKLTGGLSTSRKPIVLGLESLLKMRSFHTSRPAEEVNEKNIEGRDAPCSVSCYKDPNTIQIQGPRTNFENLDIYLGIMSNSNGYLQACDIAFALDLPCVDVLQAIQEHKKKNKTEHNQSFPQAAKPPKWYDNKRKELGKAFKIQRGRKPQFFPCTHSGPCTMSCPCVASNTLCEILCSCPSNCPRKFTGCKCSTLSKKCDASCICVRMERECGIECSSCTDTLDPNQKQDNHSNWECLNIQIQKGVSKKTILGESKFKGAGFGLFIAEPAKKGDYLGEYLGEAITNHESERRGVVDNIHGSSYLFDFNADWTIDGNLRGSKTRFMNDPMGILAPNCEVKNLLVKGEHRVKFIAKRDLRAGEELYFDYGEEFTECLPVQKGLMKGVETGRERAGKVRTLSGGGSSRKEAVAVRNAGNEDEEDEEVDEDEMMEEEMEIEIEIERPRKRRRRKVLDVLGEGVDDDDEFFEEQVIREKSVKKEGLRNLNTSFDSSPERETEEQVRTRSFTSRGLKE